VFFTPTFQCCQIFTMFNSSAMILFKFHIVPKILLATKMLEISASRYNSIKPHLNILGHPLAEFYAGQVWFEIQIQYLWKWLCLKLQYSKTFKLYLLYVFMWALSNLNSLLHAAVLFMFIDTCSLYLGIFPNWTLPLEGTHLSVFW